MNHIVDFDRELGTVTLEPGVTQAQLRAFLDEHGPEYMVPVTGAGPTASILGNALERGYGITPYADHFGAVMSIRAVLADGSVYESPLEELGAGRAAKCFKWGIGPYLDGLFTQSGFGIVTRMTIALAKRPESVQMFVFTVRHESDLERIVPEVREVLGSIGGNLGSINLMNTRRVLSMVEPYPRDGVAPGQVMPASLVDALAAKHNIGPWVGIGSIYADTAVAKACKRALRRRLRGMVKQLSFFTKAKADLLHRILATLPGQKAAALARKAESLKLAIENFSGAPSEVALPLCYWKCGTRPPAGMPMDPARDGCGLIWYSPLVPMSPTEVLEYSQFVNDTCIEHGIEPLITLTSVSPRCFDSTVPILFDPQDDDEAHRAHCCYEALLERGRERGFLPYRLPVSWMDRVVDDQHSCWQTVAKLKRALDPHDRIAPGRYCPMGAT